MDYRKKVERIWETVPAKNRGGLKFYNASDVPAPPPAEDGDTWGDWRLTLTDPPSLDYIGDTYRHDPYEVELSEIFCGNNWEAAFLNWIKHLHGKDWGSASMGDFVDAVLTISRYGYVDRKTHLTIHPAGTRSLGQ